MLHERYRYRAVSRATNNAKERLAASKLMSRRILRRYGTDILSSTSNCDDHSTIILPSSSSATAHAQKDRNVAPPHDGFILTFYFLLLLLFTTLLE
jgi:hypothetical protein|mmetsp:Transcript_4601/g.8177  ORF Transcript_4601/g.8177 Transcript_4601/m.8177 type:complete len:96 (-) Transcript_4601:703-990(-)